MPIQDVVMILREGAVDREEVLLDTGPLDAEDRSRLPELNQVWCQIWQDAVEETERLLGAPEVCSRQDPGLPRTWERPALEAAVWQLEEGRFFLVVESASEDQPLALVCGLRRRGPVEPE